MSIRSAEVVSPVSSGVGGRSLCIPPAFKCRSDQNDPYILNATEYPADTSGSQLPSISQDDKHIRTDRARRVKHILVI